MSSRRILVVLVCLAWGWASSVNSVVAQPAAKTDKLVRVTYPVADLVTPIPGYPGPDKKEALAETLIKVVTNSVAPDSWRSLGGAGTVEYFPFGMALVVHQPRAVQEEVALLLAQLRRLAEVQISIEMCAVRVSASMAKHLRLEMDENGQTIRAINDGSKKSADRFVSMDSKQAATFLKMAQSAESTTITQAPKVTIFNAQQVQLSSTSVRMPSKKLAIMSGFKYDLLPVLDAERKSVRLTLNLEVYTPLENLPSHVTKAGRTFVIPVERTLVWHLGEAANGQHLLVLATPRAIVAEEPQEFIRQAQELQARGRILEKLPDAEGTAPLPSAQPSYFPPSDPYPLPKELRYLEGAAKKAAGSDSATKRETKERLIVERLRQPINVHFKETPLSQAAKDLTTMSGIQVVLETAALRDAKVNLDTPVSINVENINMKSALNLLLKPIRLTWVIENGVLLITTESRHSRLFRQSYNIADLVEMTSKVEGHAKGERFGESLMERIQDAVAKNSWETWGGQGTIQYLPLEKKIVVEQTQEVHEEIDLLLAGFRRLKALAVETETRFVKLSANEAKQWRKALAQKGENVEVIDSAASGVFGSMDELQVFKLLEIAQGDRAAEIMQSPKLTLWNGQSGKVGGACEQPSRSWNFRLQPVVSPDRRTVRLKINLEHCAKDDAKSIERITRATRTVVVPDGRTLVWDLGEIAGRQHLFVFVTPRIQVLRETEKIFLGQDLPIPRQ